MSTINVERVVPVQRLQKQTRNRAEPVKFFVQVRFELTQALDADRYSTTTADAVQQSCRARCRLLEAALASPHARNLSVGETASLVWLLLQGHLDSVASEKLWVRICFLFLDFFFCSL